MPTHQEIASISDQEMLERMISSHDGRFNDTFWNYFDEQVGPGVPENATIVDLGCGPGLLLRDLSRRFPDAVMTGLDITQAMLDYAGTVEYAGKSPDFRLCDVTSGPLPLADNSVDLLCMVAVLHVLEDPLDVCAEIRRVLGPRGVFLLQDWVRTPLVDYLDRMAGDLPAEVREVARRRVLRLFPSHNKYTVEDWLWVLDQGGFEVAHYREINSPSFRTFVCRAA